MIAIHRTGPALAALALGLALCAPSPARADEPAEGEPAEGEPARAEPPKAEPPKAEPARAEPPRHKASPEEIKIARQTALDGLGAYKAGEYGKALGLFEQARALYPSAQILRMTGYSHLALQHWEKAVEALEAALTSPIGALEEGDRKDVEAQLARALTHFGHVNVITAAPGAVLSIDGGDRRALPLLDPVRVLEGKHKLVVSAEGHADAEQEVTVEGGKPLDIALDPRPLAGAPKPAPKPAPPPPPPPPEPWKELFPHQMEIGLIAAGAGVAFAGASLITGLAGADIRGRVEEDVALHQQRFGASCDRGDYRLCVYDRAVINQDADRADALRDASLATGITSAVLVAGGAALFLLSPESPFAPAPGPKRGAAPAPARRAASVACGPLAAGMTCKGTF